MFDQHADPVSRHSHSIEQTNPKPVSTTVKPKKKRDGSSLRKAPGAPKRFKSSYIMFFMAKQKEIKSELGEGASVGEISKRSSEKWKTLPKDERAFWDKKAEEDKERYNQEKEKYTGPWQIPWKRVKKNPNAPKRPMSAFLFFSQDKRRAIKDANPGMRNTEISRVLGGMWKRAAPEERSPHIEREASERQKYKIAIAKWREEEATRTDIAAAEQKAKWAEKASDEVDRSVVTYRAPSPLSVRASPMPVQPLRPLSPCNYYPQGSYGDYYPTQNYSVPPSNHYNPYNYQTQAASGQSQNYYRNYQPVAQPEYLTARQYQDYPLARNDSMEDSRHRNRSISPVPTQLGSYNNGPPGPIYSMSQHNPTGRNDPTIGYPDDYHPSSYL